MRERTQIDYEALRAFDKITITYSGSGDEGYINEITPERMNGVEIAGDLHEMLESAAYDILSDHFGGWEINEGSHGHMTIDVGEQQVFIHHGNIVESTEWEDKVIG